MSKRDARNSMRHMSRRDTLKYCLLPAGAFAARYLVGCSDSPTADASVPPAGTPMTNSGSVTMPGVPPKQPSPLPSAQAPAMNSAPMMPPASQPPTPMNPGAAGSGAQVGMGAGGAGANPNMPASGMANMGGAISDVAGPDVPWLSGGTKAMKGPFPDPFGANSGTACKLYPAQTIGPCYTQGPEMRQDISDGLGGLPMRISLLVVHEDCKPVANASVDIWHSGSEGIYSAYATGSICNPGTKNVMTDMFCRGVQISDEVGRVQFDTVFPGWYRGRTLHVHFTVRIDGREYATSQLYFDDVLAEEILAQGDYAARGMRDTNNMRDGIYLSGGATPEEILFETAKRPDGSIHVWKVLSISA